MSQLLGYTDMTHVHCCDEVDDHALREALERLLEEASPFASELTVLLEPMTKEDRARLRDATAHAREVLSA